jgi:hypothetical protein
VDGWSGDVVVGGALDDMVVVVSVVSLKGNVYFLTQLMSQYRCSLWRCFGTTDGHLTMDGCQAFGAKSEQFRTCVIFIIFFIDDSYRNNARQR